MLYSCTHMATVGVKGLTDRQSWQSTGVNNDMLTVSAWQWTDCASGLCDEDMERQVDEQAVKRRELEMTLKLLEKDAWAKQATVGALRKQLEDIKNINQHIGNKIRV